MIGILQVILDILWTLLKIGVTAFLVFFVWNLVIGAVKTLRKEYRDD